MSRILLIILLICSGLQAQVRQNPPTKDPFFSKPPQPKESEKIQHIHSDIFGVDPMQFEGNPYFSGNVQFSHQGSDLFADLVVLYKDQNFVKAIGNVRLQNADGSVITASEMEYDGNSQRGIARKDVVLTDPKQTIKTETLYYDRAANTAYFNSGGTIFANNSVTYTKSATYFVESRTVDLSGNINIDNGQYIVEGSNIRQNQNTNIADIFGPTTIINKQNPANRVYTESGKYNMNTREVFLNKNSTIFYNGKTLKGDKMFYNQNSGYGRATGNVLLNDPAERRFIRGGVGEVYERKDSAVITEKPYAVKVLEKDSIYFSAQKIIAYQKLASEGKKSFLRAFRQARFFKSNAQARTDSLSFNETDGILHLHGSPVLWSGARQVTGEEVRAYFDLEQEYLDSVKVSGNAFAIVKVDSLSKKDEFHQIKGRLMTLKFIQNEIHTAAAIGNAQAITYADNEDSKTREMERIGVAISACGNIEALFQSRIVQIISCNIGASTDIYPMSFISREQRFFPDFSWNNRDRLRRWQDIFLESPNYPEEIYISDDSLYEAAQEEILKEQEKNKAKQPKRNKR